jgi:hypothetical protein
LPNFARYFLILPNAILEIVRKHPFLFLLGFAVGYLPVLYFLSHIGAVPESRAEEEQEPIAVVLETLEPTSEPEPTKSTPEPTEPSPAATAGVAETPPPAPTATPDVWSPPDIEPLFAQYAGAYGVDKNILERIANCESHFNANSQNKDYLGMFQFSTSTWQKYRMQMGLDANPALRTNIEESIKTAAFVVQQRGIAPWPSCL